MITDTITAVSTPPGNAALAIIRISGSNTFEIIDRITYSSKKVMNKMLKATFHDSGKTLDKGMLCLFKAPKSYTGEDMAELYCHGSDFITNSVLELILKHCRLAEKGEFTLRAFLNNKIDLTQAEAVGNLLCAKTSKAHETAILQLEGKLSKKIKKLHEKVLNLKIVFELAIDFVEDEVSEYQPEMINLVINDILNDLQGLIETAHEGIIIIKGIKICLIGAPNVGKSSIFNAFLQSERAIVTEIPGTTRDFLEEALSLDGYLIKLIDTAGIHETTDLVELKGIEKTKDIIKDSDLVIWAFAPPINYESQINNSDLVKSSDFFQVLNKSDLLSEFEINEYRAKGLIPCSTITENGLFELKREILRRIKKVDSDLQSGIITNTRQLACVKNAQLSMLKAKEAMQNQMGFEFIAFDIQQACSSLQEVIGKVTQDDIMKMIFENFCIGK